MSDTTTFPKNVSRFFFPIVFASSALLLLPIARGQACNYPTADDAKDAAQKSADKAAADAAQGRPGSAATALAQADAAAAQNHANDAATAAANGDRDAANADATQAKEDEADAKAEADYSWHQPQ